MGVFEALALFAIGLLAGMLATVFDVIVFGTGSFVAHVSLWVLVNAVFSSHIASRKTAVLWSIPFNLGYIECYYLTTAASYEGYAKSLVVPLAAVALIAPALSCALWTAKQERNAYGVILTLLIGAGTLGSSYFLNGALSIFDAVVCVLTLLVVLVWPTRRFDVTRAAIKEQRKRVSRAFGSKPASLETDKTSEEQPQNAYAEERKEEAPHLQPTKRKRERTRLFGGRRGEVNEDRRDERPPRTSRRRKPSRAHEDQPRDNTRDNAPTSRPNAPLGTAQSARSSFRSRRWH